MKKLATIPQAIEAFKAGQMVIIVDDEDRENEGDLAIAADFATPEAINFMATYGKGLICTPLEEKICDRMGLPQMVPPDMNGSGFGTPFTISVEAAAGVSTGISAHDRSHTMAVLIDPNSTPQDIVMPGHVFPLRARAGGVLERRGQTEASVDLARLAGLTPAAVICEIMSDDGTMARLPELLAFGEKHNMLTISVEALAQYRLEIGDTNGAV
ncbi:MAG: 3,4-dihydroxy-2-butanone-4-phosphate synthase, partial [Chloroflexota bacterium]